jgi:hypothetical protein
MSGYEYSVMVHSVYEYNDTFIEGFYDFFLGKTIFIRGNSTIIAMRIETPEGTVLAEYPREYLELLRKAYKGGKEESWIFTEKGLFMGNIEVAKRYDHDSEKIREYYRSYEAVEDLNRLLESTIE